MSMYFNDMNAYNMIEKYSNETGIIYDIIMKLRADIFDTLWPTIIKSPTDEYKIYSVEPQCGFISYGIYKVKIVSDAWVYGNMNSMKIYCDTYNFVLKMLGEKNGEYRIHFESCVTDNVYYNKLPIIYFNISYKLDGNRRIFDTLPRNAEPIPGSLPPIDIRTVTNAISVACYDHWKS
jgi:hypothetical protein